MMKGIYHGIHNVIIYLLINAAAALPCAYAAGTTLHNIREGLHAEYSRIVLDCEGTLPDAIGPAQRDYFPVRFSDLTVDADLEKISGRLRGSVKLIDLQKEKSASQIRLRFGVPGARVKAFVLKSETPSSGQYRLVIDVFPQPETTTEKSKAAAAVAAPAPISEQPQPPGIERRSAGVAATQAVPRKSAAAPPIIATPEGGPQTAAAAPTVSPQKAREPAGTPAVEKTAGQDASKWVYSAEASLHLRAADGEDQSAKFEEYRHISQPVAGDLLIEAQKDQQLYFKGSATGVGQDDPEAALQVGRYGKYDLEFDYNRLIHRFAFNARTLYSGVGSGTMTLDNGLQAALDGATPAAQAATLNAYLPGASTGDPNLTRDRFKLSFHLPALDPFNLKIELGHETRQGTRPFAGAFNNLEMVELFEPIDYETTDMNISGEYFKKNLLLNFVYHFSQFSNNIDTLTFDNPLHATDLTGPSTGRIDLAPDNQYHNLAFTGALTKLPLNSQISANLAWALMMQDDNLVPFTSNTAIAAPALPVNSTDARVNTSLYNLRLTSKPLEFMRVKANLRYYDYDNRTGRIDFNDGYVETDNVRDNRAFTNLPTSYSKTRAGLDLGFDVAKRTSLGIGYKFERTDRENREVEQQDDNILKASLDIRALDWMDIRASYERTDRQIGDYNFNIYSRSGDDLRQLPQLRKYDQADMVRDRYRLQATLYPIQTLALTGAFTYGMDEFEESPYGLLEDNHYSASFDVDYTITERATLNLFYTYEKFENTQRSQERSISTFDWKADGEDRVNTLGGGVTLALIPKRLDFDLTYSYSDADGNISFTSPSGSFADYKAVDDTKLHALNSKIRYHFSKNLTLSLGYLWEKFDYEDYNNKGFSFVPTDTGGNYQGALLSGTLPQDYDAQIVYTQLTLRYK